MCINSEHVSTTAKIKISAKVDDVSSSRRRVAFVESSRKTMVDAKTDSGPSNSGTTSFNAFARTCETRSSDGKSSSVNPSTIIDVEITMTCATSFNVGVGVTSIVGAGETEGAAVVGLEVGSVGCDVGSIDGNGVGTGVGIGVGAEVGQEVGQPGQ